MNGDFSTPKDVLTDLLRNIAVQEPKHHVFGGWHDIVGIKLAERSYVVDLEGSRLKIAVRDGATMQLLLMRKREILYKVSKKYRGLILHDLLIYLEKNPSSFETKESPARARVEQPPISLHQVSDAEFQQLLARIREYSKSL